MLCGGTQRRALPQHESEEMKILIISFSFRFPEGIKPATYRVYVRLSRLLKFGGTLLSTLIQSEAIKTKPILVALKNETIRSFVLRYLTKLCYVSLVELLLN